MSAVQMWNATIVAEDLSYILVYSDGFEDKNSRSYNKFTKASKKAGAYMDQ